MAESRHGKRRGHARWLVVPVGFVASALLVWQSSYATFNATTDNPGNSWSAGTVVLTDSVTGTTTGNTMFTLTGLKAGDAPETHCIQLDYTGTLAATVKLYGAVSPGTPDLGPYVDLTIDSAGGTSSADCTTFPASSTQIFTGTLDGTTPFNAHTDYTSGLTTGFAPTSNGGGVTQTYAFRFTAGLDASAPNSVQGGSVNVTFTWEAQ